MSVKELVKTNEESDILFMDAFRKFVKMNFCVDLYIDRKDNIKKQNEELDRIETLKKSLVKEKAAKEKALKIGATKVFIEVSKFI